MVRNGVASGRRWHRTRANSTRVAQTNARRGGGGGGGGSSGSSGSQQQQQRQSASGGGGSRRRRLTKRVEHRRGDDEFVEDGVEAQDHADERESDEHEHLPLPDAQLQHAAHECEAEPRAVDVLAVDCAEQVLDIGGDGGAEARAAGGERAQPLHHVLPQPRDV
eukprot:115841-Prymnesium_polylepis.1